MNAPALRERLGASEWLIEQQGFDVATANVYETLFTIGNGRTGTRGALEEGHAGALSGVYVAGVYDSHDAIVTDLVNLPDWVDTAVFAAGTRLDVDSAQVISHERALDLSQGMLWRSTVFEDAEGNQTRLESLRCAPLHERDCVVLRLEVTPLNHSGPIRISTGLDGARNNLEALPVYPADRTFTPSQRWAKWARSQHLATEATGMAEDDSLFLLTRTLGSKVGVAVAATTTVTPSPERVETVRSLDSITQNSWFDAAEGQPIRLDKVAAFRTTRDVDAATGEDLLARAQAVLSRTPGVDQLLTGNAEAWHALWADCDAEVLGEPELTAALRCSIYHLIIAANPDDPTTNIGAKSMSGEGYRGHVFWDTEVMMLPFFTLTQPRAARALLGYRFHTLDGARRNSAENGTKGARYAWESADTGDEECPRFTPDGSDRFWTRDEEVHVSADVAYAIRRYVEATGDRAFLFGEGAEMLFETSRFWVTFAQQDADGGWHLRTVMGPDEFHSHVDDNAFTNHLVRWALRYAAQVYAEMQVEAPAELARVAEAIDLDQAEVAGWLQLAAGLAEPDTNDDGVIEQFVGFFGLDHVEVTEWDENNMPRYPAGYNHFNCETTQLLKQPDVIQLMLMLPDDFSAESKRANFEYYEPRTLHKSSLSPAMHAVMGIEVGDPGRAVEYFRRSALVDLTDNQGNTCEGMHIASAAGTWTVLTSGFGGLTLHGSRLAIEPWLPEQWAGVRYRITWQGMKLVVEVTHDRVCVSGRGEENTQLELSLVGTEVALTAGDTVSIELKPRS